MVLIVPLLIVSTAVLATALVHHLEFVSVIMDGLVRIAHLNCATDVLVTVLAPVTVVAFVIFLGRGRIVLFALVSTAAVATELV